MAVGPVKLTKRKAPELVPEAEEIPDDDDDLDEEDDDEDDNGEVGEDLVPLEPEVKAKDPFIGVRIRRLLGGSWFCGQVLDVEQGKETKEFVYLVRYHDGDRQHLTSAEVRQWSVPKAAVAQTPAVDLVGRGPAPAARPCRAAPVAHAGQAQRRRPTGQAASSHCKPLAPQPMLAERRRTAAPAPASASAPQRPAAPVARSTRQSAVLVSVGMQTMDIGLRPLRLLSRQPQSLSGHLPAHGRRRHTLELDADSELEELVEEDLALGRPPRRLPPPKRHRSEGAYDDFGDVWDHEEDIDLEDEYSRDLRWRRRPSRPHEALSRPPTAPLPSVRETHLAPRRMDSSQVDVTEVEEEYFDEEGEEEELQEYTTDEEVEEEEQEDQSFN